MRIRTMRSRHAWIAATALLALGATATAGTLPPQIRYEVLDGDKSIGHIDISLQSSPQGLLVQQRGEIVLRRMMLTATIRQTVEEHWQDRRLLGLRSETSSEMAVGSSKKSLSVVRDASGALRATVDQAAHDLPADALPLNIWSAHTLVAGAHFELTGGEASELRPSAAKAPAGDEAVRYQDQPCRRSDFESVTGDKRSTVTAWAGEDEIVCQLRIRSGRDVFTYVRRPAP